MMSSAALTPSPSSRTHWYGVSSGNGPRVPLASAGPALSGCEWCERHPDGSCPACAARRRRAVRLVGVEGRSVPEAARVMRLSVARVERLLEADADRRCLAAL